jgi:Pin2-interacting protein X1
MQSQGWVAGQGLGAANRVGFNSYDNAKLKVSFKDDNLGLGASLKSRDVEASRTGLDAFQGLLGRLNGKGEEVEKKIEDRRLKVYAAGRWGGMVFVSGGLLKQREEFKKDEGVSEEQREFKKLRNDREAIRKAKGRGNVEETEDVPMEEEEEEVQDDAAAAKAQRKQERASKRQRKEDRRRRKAGLPSDPSSDSPNDVSTSDPPKRTKRKHQTASLPTPPSDPAPSASEEEPNPTPKVSRPTVRNGRQILRGKNIAAKKLAFADAKMLDEIFMRKS